LRLILHSTEEYLITYFNDKNSSKGGEVERPDLASDLRVFDEIISQSGFRTADYEFGALTN
jgi:hypothetical protein